MPGTSEGLKWTEAVARAVATIVVAWGLFYTVGWAPWLCGLVAVAFCVGTLLVSRSGRARVLRWSHETLETPWQCTNTHCLYCCTCVDCRRDRDRAGRLGIFVQFRGPRPRHGRWSK